jgi:hypothetical protein
MSSLVKDKLREREAPKPNIREEREIHPACG